MTVQYASGPLLMASELHGYPPDNFTRSPGPTVPLSRIRPPMPNVRENLQSGASVRSESRPSAAVGRALVVDKPRFANLISRMLQGHFDVTCHDRYADGLKAVQDLLPRLALVALGGGEGLQMGELMGMSARGRQTPSLLTCIRPNKDLVDRALKAGFGSVLAKPFPPSALVERAGAILRSARRSAVPDDYRAHVDFIRSNPRPIEGLATIPDTHAKIRHLSGTESSVSSGIADEVGMGLELQDAVLSLAAAYPAVYSRRVATVRGAVSLGGFCEVANLALVVETYQALADYRSVSRFDQEAFWKHSVGTALIARTVANRVKESAEAAFMAGFLHDIGKLVLDRFYPSFHGPVTDAVRRQHVHTTQVELPWLGTTHAHVGAYVAVNWHLDESLVEAILAHHAPTGAKKHTRLASVVHVANAICGCLEYGSSGEVVKQDKDDPALYKSLLKLGVGPQVLELLIDAAEVEVRSAETFLDVLMRVGPTAR